MNRILVMNSVAPVGLSVFGNGYEVGSDIVGPEAIVLRSAKLDTDDYPNLRAVARAGAGVNNISVGKATEKGICVFNTPGANANAVAELVFIMLGLYARRVDQALSFMQTLGGDDTNIAAQVEAKKAAFSGFELAGKTIGVIGLGKIGVLVANAAVKQGMRVVGYDAFPTLTNMHQLDARVEIVRQMEEAIVPADILSVHVPLTPKTRHIIGAKEIALVRPGGILLNYARDGIFDDAAVLEALDQGKVAVFISDFPTSALLANPKVICTPHLGASTAESEENCATMACKQLKNYLDYGVVQNSVNFPVVEVFPSHATKMRLAIVNKDVPNMIAVITGALGSAGVNIQAFANESNGTIGYNLIDLEVEIGTELIRQIRELPNVLRIRVLKF